MRLFTALELPPAVVTALHGWASEHASQLRVLPPESLHATLVFLGERSREDVERIGAALRASAAPVRGLSLGRPAALGRGQALAIDLVDVEGTATALQRQLADELGVVEDRPYRPHVTVARGRNVKARGLPPLPSIGAFDATAATLFLSRPGSQYEALVSVSLVVGGS
jgi:2'-5' RNA ligase